MGLPYHDAVHVISDLHIGGAPGTQMLRETDRLVGYLGPGRMSGGAAVTGFVSAGLDRGALGHGVVATPVGSRPAVGLAGVTGRAAHAARRTRSASRALANPAARRRQAVSP